MTVIDVRDGGMAFSSVHDVMIGVIQLVVQEGESAPVIYKGYCWPEEKQEHLVRLRRIVWEGPSL